MITVLPQDDSGEIGQVIMRAMIPKTSVLVWFDSLPIVNDIGNIFGIRTDFAGLEQVRKTICPDLRMKLGLCG